MNRSLLITNCTKHNKNDEALFFLNEVSDSIDLVGWDWSHGRTEEIQFESIKKRITVPKKFGSFISRFWALCVLIFKARRSKLHKVYDYVYINSFEMLIISNFLGIKAKKKFYEISDIFSFFTELNFLSSLMRYIEKVSCKNCFFVISSPAYFDYIKNYLNKSPVVYPKYNWLSFFYYSDDNNYSQENSVGRQKEDKKVLYNGILRSKYTYEFLKSLSKKTNITAKLAGLTQFKLPLKTEGIQYVGEYNDKRLDEIMDDVDFVLTCDIGDDWNSKNLITNRFFQAILFGKYQISVGNCLISKIIKKLEIGHVLDFDLKSLDLEKVLKRSKNIENKIYIFKEHLMRIEINPLKNKTTLSSSGIEEFFQFNR